MLTTRMLNADSQFGKSDVEQEREKGVTPEERRSLLSPSQATQHRLPEDWIYDNIKDAIYHCRKIDLIYLGALGYTALTIATTPTLDFFREQSINLPVMNAQIPLNYYIVLAPLVLIGLFIYKQLYLHKANTLIKFAVDRCKFINKGDIPECSGRIHECTLNRVCKQHLSRIYPWIIIHCRLEENKPGSDARKDRLSAMVNRFQRAFVSLFLWWLLPVMLILLSVFVIKKHSLPLSAYLLSVTCLGMAVVIFFWYHQQIVLGRPRSMMSSICAKLMGTAGCCFIVVLVLLNMAAFQGRLWFEDPWPGEKKALLLPRVVRKLVFADLSREAIVQEGDDGLDYWINLESRHFEGADLSKAKLRKANLKHAFMNHALLRDTKLEEADLYQAHAEGADFSGARLEEAVLGSAQLAGADFTNAKLQKADFNAARLKNANFEYADLSGAKFTFADGQNAKFREANLQYAHLETIQGIGADQIYKASNYQLAYYNRDLIAQLGLPVDHNRRVDTRHFSRYDFKNALLWHADLSNADITRARFQGANLTGANLQNANLTDAILHQTNFQEADLTGITYTDVDQFAEVKTLYKAKMDEELRKELKKRWPQLFVKPPPVYAWRKPENFRSDVAAGQQ